MPHTKAKLRTDDREWIEVTSQNTADIKDQSNDIKHIKGDIDNIKGDIDKIKSNHLFHIEKDVAKQSKLIDKMDARLWYILILLVASTAISMLGKVM